MGFSRKEVIMGDDDPDMPGLTRNIFSEDGHRVYTANHPDKFLEIVRGNKRKGHIPDLIVTDFNYKVDGKDGIWLIGQVRRILPRIQYPNLRIVLMTSAFDPRIEKLRMRGKIPVITKPNVFDDLVKISKDLLKPQSIS